MFRGCWNDVRYAARKLKRTPGFTAAAILTVALGVGVNTGIFTILNGVLFRELPVPGGAQIVSVYQTVQGVRRRAGNDTLFSTNEYREYRDGTRTLVGLAGYSDPTRTTLGGETPQRIVGTLVTCNYFDVLRQPPALGRSLTDADCNAGAPPVVVLSHDLWMTAFAGDRTIVGREVQLNRVLLTVVGVAAPGTYGGFGIYDSAYFAPISTQQLLLPAEDGFTNDATGWLFLIGRRAEGASLERVRAELGILAARIDAQQAGRATTLTIDRATPLAIPPFRTAALAVGTVAMTAFGLILLIACANVANLLLARASARGREIAVRLSLGASRARVVRQLLTESVLLALTGGAVGSIAAVWSFQLLVALALPSVAPAGIPPLVLDATPDVRLFAVALLLTLGAGILFGLAPALQLSKADLHSAMKDDAAGVGGRRPRRLQGTLVGAQVAFCMALSIGAALLMQGLIATRSAHPGFEYRNVVVASLDLLGAGYDAPKAATFTRQLRDRLDALPGIETTAYALLEPLASGRRATRVRLPNQDEAQAQVVAFNAVTPGYFSVVGIPIVRGRTFADPELDGVATTAIVSESTADRYWRGEDPIGKTLLWTIGDRTQSLQVVGVARDAQVTTMGAVDAYYVYLPAGPAVATNVRLLARSRVGVNAAASGVIAAVRALDSGVAVRVSPLEANLDYWRGLSGAVTGLAAALGGLALALASVGIYGVVAYFVGQRAREIGIRIALGARPRSVLGLVLRKTMRPVVVGAALGVVGAVAVSDLLTSVMFGVSPVDPLGVSAGILVVLSVALTAATLAARRSTEVDPIATLRCE